MKHSAILLMTLLAVVACGGGNKQNPDNPDNPDVGTQGKDYTDTDEFAWVDMGTTVLWGTINLGANHSTDYGSYLEWGNQTVDNGEGRLPTYEEYEQLASVKDEKGVYSTGPCSTKWGKVNGVYGITYTNKKSGNAIFMPAAGYLSTYGNIYYGVGSNVCNWTQNSEGDRAIHTSFSSSVAPYAGAYTDTYRPYTRCTIRLVKDK